MVQVMLLLGNGITSCLFQNMGASYLHSFTDHDTSSSIIETSTLSNLARETGRDSSAYTEESTLEDGSKLFRCTQCQYTTKRRWNLTRHLENHLDNKVQCQLCDHISIGINSLQQHLKRYHQNPTPCPVCGEHFTRYRLLAHIRKLHADYPIEQLSMYQGDNNI